MMPHGKSPVVGLVQDLGERNLVKIWEWKYLGWDLGGLTLMNVLKNINIVMLIVQRREGE